MDKKKLRDAVLKKLKQMEAVRLSTEADRWEACELSKHRTDSFNLVKSGTGKKLRLSTNAHVDAIKTTVAGIMGYLISQNIRWFSFRAQTQDAGDGDDIFGAKDYLEKVISVILGTMAQGNFYSASHLATQDAFIQGTSAEFIVDDIDGGGGVYYDVIDPREFYIGENHCRKVDTFFRVYQLPAEVAYKRWGDKLPMEVRRLIRNDAGHQMIKFLHAIYPREDVLGKDGRAIISTEKKWASVHYSYTGNEVFEESGYDEFPVAVHRWTLNGTSPYGSSPVIELIEEIKKLDRYEFLYAKAIDKNVDPPIFAPEILKGRLNLNPGAKNWLNIAQTGAPQLFPTSLEIQHLAAKIAEVTAGLNRALHTDLFNILMRQEQQRTATEVREIKGEGLVLLSSIIGNMQEEKISPLVMRTYNILRNAGIIPPPPEELKKASYGGKVKVELDGPLAQNMRAYHQTTGITQGMQALAAVMQLNPDAQVNVDFDQLIRQAMSANGMPQTIIREQAEVKKIKERQQEMLEQQKQMEQAQMRADAIGKMGRSGTPAQELMQGVYGR